MSAVKGICVIGLGNVGLNLATTLAKSRQSVLVIDADQEKIDKIGDIVDNAVCGD
ncbi:MAG: NAD-binding protein, partial [Clostridia bacterium]|nr:NAD-binding protein [Clostridia bacterium]